MKKILALILVLCLALAAIPVLAEDDLSGTWYMVMMGLTGGTFDLNADGTFTGISAVTGSEEQSTEGSWTTDGTIVTLTLEGKNISLTYDGNDLLFGEEAIAALGDGDFMSGMDTSVLSSLIRFSREPGTVTAAEFTAFTSDGTVPEGKTEEEMTAIQAEIMTLLLGMMDSMDTGNINSTVTTDPETASAGSLSLTLVEENFYLRKGYSDRFDGVYIAKFRNDTETPLYIDKGSLTLLDADGNEVGKDDFMHNYGSRYLVPGETTFVALEAHINEGASVDKHETSFEVITTGNLYLQDTEVELAGAELRIVEDTWTNYYATAAITNTGDLPLSHVNVVIAVKANDGSLLQLVTGTLGQDELAAGSTITLVNTLDSRVVDYCAENNLTMTDVEAYAWKDSGY